MVKKKAKYIDAMSHSRPILSFTLGIEPGNASFAKLSS